MISLLREQLAAANDANVDLSEDLMKATDDCNALKEELSVKETKWKEEQQVHNQSLLI